ncbi:MAG: polysaccharide biosynthesis protein [Sphingobacteriales bacterium]|nr:MAG: polysaccharide biosynthesis protein [Sphingobacteriales bacterium]
MLVRHSLIYGLTSVISGVLGFLLIAIYTRLLSPAEYGDYSLLIAAVSFTDATVFLWIRNSLMRQVKDEHDDKDAAYITNAMAMYWSLSLACVILPLLAFGASAVFGFNMPPFMAVMGLVAMLEGLTNLVIFMARIRVRHNVFCMLSLLKPGLALCLGALFIWLGMGMAGAIYGMLVSLAICTVIGFWHTTELRRVRKSLLNRKVAMDIFTFGFPLVLALSIQFATRMTDRVLIETLIGDDATGLYAAAQDLPLKILMIIVYSIHLAAYPLAVKAMDKHGEDAARKQLATNFTLLAAVSFPACIGLAVLAPNFAWFFVGEEFRPFVMANLGWFTAIALMNCLIQYYFILPFNLAKKTGLLMQPFIAALIINVIVSYFGIKHFGVMGAALGSFVGYSTLFVVTLLLSRKVFPMPLPWKATAQLALASFVMGAVVWALPKNLSLVSLICSVTVGAMVYAAMVYIQNVADMRPVLHRKARYYVRKIKKA